MPSAVPASSADNQNQNTNQASVMSHTTTTEKNDLPYTGKRLVCGMIDRLFIIYQATHKVKGSYIGYTSQGLPSRASDHISTAKRAAVGKFADALRDTGFSGWEWKIIGTVVNDEEAAGIMEAQAILERKPVLNSRQGGKWVGNWREGEGLGGKKNRGRGMAPEVKEWFSKFHATRPRKRVHDREKMISLKNEGKSISQIARLLRCDTALVSRVVSGKYRK